MQAVRNMVGQPEAGNRALGKVRGIHDLHTPLRHEHVPRSSIITHMRCPGMEHSLLERPVLASGFRVQLGDRLKSAGERIDRHLGCHR